MHRLVVPAFVALALVAGCGAEDPGPGVTPGLDSGTTPIPGSDSSSTPGTMSLTVDPLGNNTTCYESIAVQGTATPGSDVYALGGSSTSDIRSSHPQTGRFCIDVPLRKNQVNEIEVWAKHPQLGPADPVKITVIHDDGAAGCSATGEPTDPEPTDPEAKNVALGAPVASKDGPYQNSSNMITDGDPKTWAAWGGGDWYNPWSAYGGWVMVTVDQIAEVDKVVITWRDKKGTGDQEFGKEYELWYTAIDTDTFNKDDGKWVMPATGHVTAGDGDKDEFSLKGEPVRAVALRLLQDGKDGYNENFAIAEIEIFAKPQGGTTPYVPSRPGTCDTIGGGI